MKTLLTAILIGLAFLGSAACGGTPSSDATTATSALPAPASGPSEPVSGTYRLDLGSGVVVAFVEGLTPEIVGKVAYVTHVPTGSQVVLDTDGNVVGRHDGRADGPKLLDSILDDDAAMARILEGLTNEADVNPRPHTISWVPMVKFGGVHYLRQWDLVGKLARAEAQVLTTENLGPELYRVAFRGDGYAGPWYRYQDGDATFLNPGTSVYGVKSYSPEFRLATLKQGRATLYEADTNPHAKTGGDLLDIRGKVTAIDILNDDDEMTVLGTMVDETTIEGFVDLVLEAPVDQRSRDHDGPRYFLGIRLADGKSVVRVFWLETGELSRGIMTDPFATLPVWWKIPPEHLPVGTDGGRRISERLAARLGLAYLSLPVPELNVTGKPHSPTARLMRRSEFTAMRGGH